MIHRTPLSLSFSLPPDLLRRLSLSPFFRFRRFARIDSHAFHDIPRGPFTIALPAVSSFLVTFLARFHRFPSRFVLSLAPGIRRRWNCPCRTMGPEGFLLQRSFVGGENDAFYFKLVILHIYIICKMSQKYLWKLWERVSFPNLKREKNVVYTNVMYMSGNSWLISHYRKISHNR